MRCEGKRRYRSASAARRAHRRAGFHIRAYPCEFCRGFHVTNDEKRDGDYVSEGEKREMGRRRHLRGSELRKLLRSSRQG